MKHDTLTGPEREAQILTAAVRVAARHGFSKFTLQQVADEAGVHKTLPIHYFGTMVKLRRKVMRAAVKQEVLSVIAQGLALRDPYAQKASDDVKARALHALTV